jgi:hypothetical protein
MKPACLRTLLLPLLLGAGVVLAAPAAPKKAPETGGPPPLETRATDILKASSAKLAAAKAMSFTAVVSYESSSRLGPPLVYTSKSDVTMQRPNKLKVVTLGDGPATEFYYDGKVMMAYAPAENLVAVADAPATVDETLAAVYTSAAIYYPFEDVIVTDWYKDIAAGPLTKAFYIGQSNVVGGVATDMVGYVTGDVFLQAWIGADDKLPRRLDAVYLNDKAKLRHVLELSKWELNGTVAADAFGSAKAAAAKRINFSRPDAKSAAAAPKAAAPKAAPKTPAAKTN